MHAVISGDELDEGIGTGAVAFIDAAAFIVAALLAFAGQLIGQCQRRNDSGSKPPV